MIVDQDDAYVTVQFENVSAQKVFAYPACFQSYLSIIDSSIATVINEELQLFEKQKREEEKKRKAEEAAERRFYYSDQNVNANPANDTEIRPFENAGQFCGKFKDALALEISYLKRTKGKRQHAFDGKRINHVKGKHVYVFESEEELYIPDETEISLYHSNTITLGKIISCIGFTIIIDSFTYLGEEVPSVEFTADAWWLLELLIERLNDLRMTPIVNSLVCDGFKSIDFANFHITTGQQTAIEMSKLQPILFIWGPPGTGKTETLANIALEHIKIGHRILMLSYSNVSVDGAILRIDRIKPDLKKGTIIRYGYPQNIC